MTYFCFLASDYSDNAHLEPLDAETVEEAKAQAVHLFSQHVSATAARIYLDTEEIAVLERSPQMPEAVFDAADLKQNTLLTACDFPGGRLVSLSEGDVLDPEGGTVWFPVSALVQMESRDGGTLAGWIDNSGGVGVMEALLPADQTCRWRVRVPGTALALTTTEVANLLDESPDFRLAILRWLHSSAVQARDLAVVNAGASASARVASLLARLSRANGNRQFALDQTEIARLLRLQRTTVCGIMVALRKQRLTAHARGRVRVLDLIRLENLAGI